MTQMAVNQPSSDNLKPEITKKFISLAVYFYTGIFLVGAIIIFFLQGKEFGLKQAFQFKQPWLILVYGILTAIGVILAGILLSERLSFIRKLEHEFRTVLGQLKFHHCIILALSSGLAEETFFRGGLQPLIGLVPTSLVFGLAHFPLKKTLLPWTVFAFIMGLLLGWLYLETQSLFTPIITHSLINLVNLYRLTHNNLPSHSEWNVEE
ncbi:lysostaphin resistance A-like protein [Planctomycetota bacterium]